MDDLRESWRIFTELATNPIALSAVRFLIVWLLILLFL